MVLSNSGHVSGLPKQAEKQDSFTDGKERTYLIRNQVYGKNSLNTQFLCKNPLDFGVGKDDYMVNKLTFAAPEIIRVGDQYYIVALKTGLNGMIAAKIKFVEKSSNKM